MRLIHLTIAATTPDGWRAIADDGTLRQLPARSLDERLVTLRVGQRVWAELSDDEPPTVVRVGIGPRDPVG